MYTRLSATPSSPLAPAATSDENQFLKILSQAGTAYLSFKGQRDLLKINQERARQGLSPITAAEAGTAPTIVVQHELPPEATAAGNAFKRALPWIGAGVAAWFVWRTFGPRLMRGR